MPSYEFVMNGVTIYKIDTNDDYLIYPHHIVDWTINVLIIMRSPYLYPIGFMNYFVYIS